MSGISFSALLAAGINPADYHYAGRILAGQAPMPIKPDPDLSNAINYIQEHTMTQAAKKAGRKTLATAEVVGPQFSGATPPDMAEEEAGARQALALVRDNARAVAEQFGYEGALSAGAIEDEIRFYQRRTAEACIELGKRMLILKELTPHGEFLDRLALLGFGRSTAYRFMQSARKFSKLPKLGNLTVKADSAGKFLELLVLDDDEIKELEGEGSILGITLDDIDCMSASELRGALREAKEEGQAKDRLLQEKNAKIDRLSGKGKKLTPWPDEVAGLKDDINGMTKVLDEGLGKLLTLIDATEISMQPLEAGSDALQGYKTVAMHLNESIERAAMLVAGLRKEFGDRLFGFIDADLTNTLED